MTRVPLVGLVVAAMSMVAATTALGPGAGPASAASCSSASGVTVIVDPGALGGALVSACDSGTGQSADARFTDAGVALTYAQRQPGFVCRVAGAPASDPCVDASPADAYWALFWTDGESGSWTYSALGIGGLEVPEGGALALAWQQGTERRAPSTAAPVASPAPTAVPTSKPKPTPTTTPPPTTTAPPRATPAPPTNGAAGSVPPAPSDSASPGGGSTAAKPTGGESTGEEPTRRPSRAPRPSAGRSADATPLPAETPSDRGVATGAPAASEPESARVPTWLTLSVLVMLLIAIGVTTMAARRRTRS